MPKATTCRKAACGQRALTKRYPNQRASVGLPIAASDRSPALESLEKRPLSSYPQPSTYMEAKMNRTRSLWSGRNLALAIVSSMTWILRCVPEHRLLLNE